MMGVYVHPPSQRLSIGNWFSTYTDMSHKDISMSKFLETLPPDGPLTQTAFTGYGPSESDIATFNEIVNKLQEAQVAHG